LFHFIVGILKAHRAEERLTDTDRRFVAIEHAPALLERGEVEITELSELVRQAWIL
jgi:hypothetical protein